jgi:hypothetical protein
VVRSPSSSDRRRRSRPQQTARIEPATDPRSPAGERASPPLVTNVRAIAPPRSRLQAKLRADDRPTVARFTELAPAHPPIPIQRWSMRRIALLSGAAISTIIAVSMLARSVLAGFR